ncbi:MAG: type VI secretion system contractile sheath large subunit [Planctomycetaceae bacterium]
MLTHALATADQRINSQLSEILHHPSFQQLESSWRGMHFLVMHTETGNSLKLKMFPVTKEELRRDLNNAPDLDMSIIFKRVHVRESSTNEDAPFGLLIGDFEFDNSPDDHTLLQQISRVCAKNFCPMISAISPDFLGLQQWSELAQPMDIQGRFDRLTSATWSAFRDSEDSRFVVLTLPRVLACLPGHLSNRPFDTLATCERLNELTPDESTAFQYEGCWMNAAYVLAADITRTFEETGWVTDFHGVMDSGVSENVPACQMLNLEGGTSVRISAEVRLAGRRELELKNLGWMPLCYWQQLDTYLFSFTQTCHRSKRYLDPDATANAELAAQLPFVLASSRIAHFLQCIARDTHRPFVYRDEIEERLNHWIKKYVAPVSADDPLKSQYPLAAASISVQDIPGQPGSSRVIALLNPYLRCRKLTTHMRISIELLRGTPLKD